MWNCLWTEAECGAEPEQDICEPPGQWGPRHAGPACSGPGAPAAAGMKAGFQSTNLQVSNSEGNGKLLEAGQDQAFVGHAFASIQLEKLVVLPILPVTLMPQVYLLLSHRLHLFPHKEASWKQEIFPANTKKMWTRNREGELLKTPLYYPKPGVKSGWSVRVTKSTSKALHCWFFELLKLKQVFEKVLGRKGLTFFFF